PRARQREGPAPFRRPRAPPGLHLRSASGSLRPSGVGGAFSFTRAATALEPGHPSRGSPARGPVPLHHRRVSWNPIRSVGSCEMNAVARSRAVLWVLLTGLLAFSGWLWLHPPALSSGETSHWWPVIITVAGGQGYGGC